MLYTGTERDGIAHDSGRGGGDIFRQYHLNFVTASIGVFEFKYKHTNAHPEGQVATLSVDFT